MTRFLFVVTFFLLVVPASAQVAVEIDLSAPVHPISPYIYGRNNSLSDNPASPLSASAWSKLKDAGVTFLRENGGNNATKYNWRRKLGSHPDWYNNVYPHDWDYAARSLQQNMPHAQGMWSFQLIGKAARTQSANFNDWGYNQSQWWTGVNQNLAGGGVVNTSGGSKAQQEGNPELYLEQWTADSTVGILDHWFGPGGIGVDKKKILYWNMDNEPEIWSGTHDDIVPSQISAETFMQQYFDIAKKARAKFPEIKLVGPVTANEWQWYNWANTPINVGGVTYPWLKYFIKRVAEEQKASGVRLLDVLDIHYYPSSTTVSNVVQYHRVFFDKNYTYPEANGVKNINGSWDNSQNKEYVLQRCRDWLTEYMGADHGVTFGVTEIGIPDIGANGVAVWYAGMLGEFMRQSDMELFSPWYWYPAMWEVLHQFTRYNKSFYVKSTSSEEELVSAYPSTTAAGDSVTAVIVNRSTSTAKNVKLTFRNFALAEGPFDVYRLNNLSSGETFLSRQNNALKKSTVAKAGNEITVSLPPLSTTSVILKGTRGEVVTGIGEHQPNALFEAFPTAVASRSSLTCRINGRGPAKIEIFDPQGKSAGIIYQGVVDEPGFTLESDISGLQKGGFVIRLTLNGKVYTRKIVH